MPTAATKPAVKKRTLKSKKLAAVYHLGETGKAWQETQPRNRVTKLRTIGASEMQVEIMAVRDFWALSKWVRLGLKELRRKERKNPVVAKTLDGLKEMV